MVDTQSCATYQLVTRICQDLDLARWECKRLEKRLAQALSAAEAGETAANLDGLEVS